MFYGYAFGGFFFFDDLRDAFTGTGFLALTRGSGILEIKVFFTSMMLLFIG